MNAKDEIKAAIRFYEKRGWDWTMIVAYLSACAVGHWPLPKGYYIKRIKV